MTKNEIGTKQAFSTWCAGGGDKFEWMVQSLFTVLMLEGAKVLWLSTSPIQRVRPQARELGYATDDLIVFFGENDTLSDAKLLVQVKHQITISEKDPVFAQVMQQAWQDYNNESLFSKRKDFIALITGPLSAVDVENTRIILEWARDFNSGEEFEAKVASNVSSIKKREKLNAFRVNLNAANKGIPLTPDELLFFLKRFDLISVDLDITSSVVKSLLYTIIGNSETHTCESIWLEINEIVSRRNINGTFIKPSDFPLHIQNYFKKKRDGKIFPFSLTQGKYISNKSFEMDYLEIISSALFGAWDLNSECDIKILSKLLKHDVTKWSNLYPAFFTDEFGPVLCRAGKCEVKDRLGFWIEVGSKIGKNALDLFEEIAITILAERDPGLGYNDNTQTKETLFSEKWKYSQVLRKGVVDTLALLGCQHKYLEQCESGKPKAVAETVVRKLLYNTNWEEWASLGVLLPILAEASPEEFLKSLEQFLKRECNQNSMNDGFYNGVNATNCIDGIILGLETLAWDGDFFLRAIKYLGFLCGQQRDDWSRKNSFNSLVEIFLPWSPHTTVSVEKRKAGLNLLKKEYPELAWELLLKLLRNKQFTSFGTRKPIWRQSISCDWKEEITFEAYAQNVNDIGSLVIEMAKGALNRLEELSHYIAKLPSQALHELIPLLGSKDLLDLSELERLPIWYSLMTLVAKHRRFSDADWALDSEKLDALTKVAVSLQPESPTLYYQQMFDGENYFKIEDGVVTECEYKELEDFRIKATEKIIELEGVEAAISFAENIGNPLYYGVTLGQLTIPINGALILPDLLDSKNRHLLLMAKGFVRGNFEKLGWNWIEEQPYANWTLKQKGVFLSELPFNKRTWDKVEECLNSDDEFYWKHVEVKLRKDIENNLNYAIDKLIDHGKLGNAMKCLAFQLRIKKPINSAQAVKVLSALCASEYKFASGEIYDMLEIITFLQENVDVNIDDVIEIEWGLLPTKSNYPQFISKRIEERLSADPEYFCDIFNFAFLGNEGADRNKDSKYRKEKAQCAWDLLSNWKRPPGLTDDGSFSSEKFLAWLKQVQLKCSDAKFLKIAMGIIGKVLVNVHSDDVNFMHKEVSEILENKEYLDMLDGYKGGILSVHSIRFVDIKYPVENGLYLEYKKQADLHEEQGQFQIANMFREIAENYKESLNYLILS